MKNLLYIFLILSIISACNSSKKTKKSKEKKQPEITVMDKTSPPDKKEETTISIDPKIKKVLDAVYANELNFKTLYSKVKTKATIDGKTQSFTTQTRWQKNKQIWMSMTIIGIEGARVLMNKDSIKIIDKLNSRNILKPISYIQQKAYINLTFNDIEKLFLGQPILLNKSNMSLVENPTENILKSTDDRFVTVLKLDKQNKITSIFITDKLKNQTLNADYSNFVLLGGKYFPKNRTIAIVNNTKSFNMTMEFNDLDISRELTYPFEINPKYKNE